ncbi:MAG TPA: tetratricopeptide repeat protein [Steroidobacteraceae bacterium]|nr:tetratricopeptide repeat protein [Steroidobacteraceae bacterium]
MDDYLSEKEQWEWIKTQVRENGPAVILAVALAVAAVFGWRWWQGHQDIGRLQAGDKYMQMVHALEQGNRSQGLVVLGELERDYPGSPYTDQAKLLSARVYVDEGQLDRAAGELAAVAEHSKDQDLAQVARLRLARVQIAQGKADNALATLGSGRAGAFAARYHEVRGDAYYAKGDKAAALQEYRSAQSAGEGTDAQLLGLKIADLDAGAPAAATAKTVPPNVK